MGIINSISTLVCNPTPWVDLLIKRKGGWVITAGKWVPSRGTAEGPRQVRRRTRNPHTANRKVCKGTGHREHKHDKHNGTKIIEEVFDQKRLRKEGQINENIPLKLIETYIGKQLKMSRKVNGRWPEPNT